MHGLPTPSWFPWQLHSPLPYIETSLIDKTSNTITTFHSTYTVCSLNTCSQLWSTSLQGWAPNHQATLPFPDSISVEMEFPRLKSQGPSFLRAEVLDRGGQWCCLPRGYLAMSGDIVGCYSQRALLGSSAWKPGMPVGLLQGTGQTLTHIDYPVLNISAVATAEKPCCNESFPAPLSRRPLWPVKAGSVSQSSLENLQPGLSSRREPRSQETEEKFPVGLKKEKEEHN